MLWRPSAALRGLQSIQEFMPRIAHIFKGTSTKLAPGREAIFVSSGDLHILSMETKSILILLIDYSYPLVMTNIAMENHKF